jgi:hypothetical protein
MLKRLVVRIALIVAVLFTPIGASAGDAVTDWNQIALAATTTANQGPIPQIRTMAIVHVSMHDAVNAITCDYRTYLSIRCGAAGTPEAAAIGAAHRALVGLLPAQASTFGAARAAALAAHGLTESDPGVAFGEAVADMVLALRSTDGSAQAQFPYTAPGAGEPGVWVSVGAVPAVLPGWGNVTPWVVRSVSRFQLDGPPRLHSRRYARDYNEVKELGSLTSTARTDEQTEIARFWLASPTMIWNGIARQFIQAHGLYELTRDAVPDHRRRQPAPSRWFIWRPRTRASRAGAPSTRSIFGDPTPQSTTVTSMTTCSPKRIRPGHRCSQRRRFPNTYPDTRPTAARWRLS